MKIHSCDQGRIFVGLITAEASVDTYIGGDSYGWGFIGTRSLWHDKKKIAEFGPSFGTDSVVNLRFNSDTGTLYINVSSSTTGGGTGGLSAAAGAGSRDWEVVKSNLPPVPLFPAVSMHHKDDSISIQLQSIVSSNGASNQRLTRSEQQHVSLLTSANHYKFLPVVAYVQMLMTAIDSILLESETALSNKDHMTASSYVSHPFITVLLPSLVASLLSNRRHDSSVHGYLALQLLPYLTVVTKRLGSVYDTVTHILQADTSLSPMSNNQLDNKLHGCWKCRSTSPSGLLEYNMILNPTLPTTLGGKGSPSDPHTDPRTDTHTADDSMTGIEDESFTDTHGPSNRKSVHIIKLRGHGRVSSSSFSIQGMYKYIVNNMEYNVTYAVYDMHDIL